MIVQFLLFAAIGTSTPGQCILLPEWVYPTNGVPTLLGKNIPGLPSNRWHRIDRDAALSYFAAIDGYYERKMRPYTAEQVFVGEVIGTPNTFRPWYVISTNFLADVTNDANRVFTNYWRRVDNRLRPKALELANDWKGKVLGRPEVVYYGSTRFGECKDWITYSNLIDTNAVVLGLSEVATNGLWLGINDAKWFGETFDRGLGYNSPLMLNDAVMYRVGFPDPTFVTNRTQTSWTQLVARAGGRVFANAVTETNLTRRVTADDIAFASEVQAVVDKTYHGSDVGYVFRPDEIELSGGEGNTVVFIGNGAEFGVLTPMYDANSNFTGRVKGRLSVGGLQRRNEVWNESVATNRAVNTKMTMADNGFFGAGVDFGSISGGGPVTMQAYISNGNLEDIPGYIFDFLTKGVRYPLKFHISGDFDQERYVEVEIVDDDEFHHYAPIGTYSEFEILSEDLYHLAEFALTIVCQTGCRTWRSEDTGLTLEPPMSRMTRGDCPFLVPHRSQLGNVASVSVQWFVESLFSWYVPGDPYRYSAGGFNIPAPHGGFTPEKYHSLVDGQMRYIFNEQLRETKRRVLAESGAGIFDNPIASLSGHFENIANGWKSNLRSRDCVFDVDNNFIDIDLIVSDDGPRFVWHGTNVALPRDPYFGTPANYVSKIGLNMTVDEEGMTYDIRNTPSVMPIIYWKFSNLPCSD